MVFLYADYPAPRSVDNHVGIPDIGLGRNRLGFTSGFSPADFLAVHALIGKVGKINHAAGHGEGASTVFVHPGTHAERRRRHIRGFASGITAHQYISTGPAVRR